MARVAGGPDAEVIDPLRDFLARHRDRRVIVEWRVEE
jgi:hypothetical protein